MSNGEISVVRVTVTLSVVEICVYVLCCFVWLLLDEKPGLRGGDKQKKLIWLCFVWWLSNFWQHCFASQILHNLFAGIHEERKKKLKLKVIISKVEVQLIEALRIYCSIKSVYLLGKVKFYQEG